MTSLFIFGQSKWTPLMIASQNKHVDVVNVLLQHGASVDLQNKVKLHLLTFLHIAMYIFVTQYGSTVYKGLLWSIPIENHV